MGGGVIINCHQRLGQRLKRCWAQGVPTSSLCPKGQPGTQKEQTQKLKGGWTPARLGQSAGQPHRPQSACGEPAVAQRGQATCSRSPSAQATEVLSVFPDGWLLIALLLPFCLQICVSASFQVPCSPPSFHLALLCPVRPVPLLFSACPVSVFWPLCLACPLFSASFTPTLPSQSLQFLQGHPKESGHSESLDVPLPCGCCRKGGQRVEEGGCSSQSWDWGPAPLGEETRKQGTWGQRAWGVRAGKGCLRAVNESHSQLYGQIWG